MGEQAWWRGLNGGWVQNRGSPPIYIIWRAEIIYRHKHLNFIIWDTHAVLQCTNSMGLKRGSSLSYRSIIISYHMASVLLSEPVLSPAHSIHGHTKYKKGIKKLWWVKQYYKISNISVKIGPVMNLALHKSYTINFFTHSVTRCPYK